jgi:tetratricopeptide (TPR) repeat protein
MKKILIALSLILSLTMVSAQPKNAADALKAVTKAEAAAADAKKAAKPATWVALAKAYIEAYDQPSRNILTGTPQQEVKLFLKDQKILSTTEKQGAEATYSVDSYADKDLYYNSDGILEFFLVTKPAVEGDLLGKAIKALEQAKAVDPKGSKAKDITSMMEDIHGKLANEALSEYLGSNFAKAADLFKKTTECASNPLLGKTDETNTYYTALVSNMAGNKEQAIEFYKKCLDMGHYQDGFAFANLAEVYRSMGDKDACKATLEEGFVKFPENSNILIGLINHYIDNQEDTGKLFELLHSAQAIDPKNASLFYVEGNVYKQLGDIENAAKLYTKSAEVDPNYVFAPLGQGVLYYDRAIELQTKAGEELDDNKYLALVKEMDETLEKAIAPFEAAFAKTQDNEIKVAIAEYLKNIYFRLRDKNPEYEALSKKYEAFVKGEN